MDKPVIAITIGDPAGIGPEVAMKTALSEEVRRVCRPFLVGTLSVVERHASWCSLDADIRPAPSVSDLEFSEEVLPLLDMGEGTIEREELGRPDARWGGLSMAYVEHAARLCLSGDIAGMTTAPICKEAIRAAGYRCQGHTDYLGSLCDRDDYVMMLVGGGIRTALATVHISLRSVPVELTKGKVLNAIEKGAAGLKRLGIERPRIAVNGLNPHAGEGGAFGDEEERIIAPAVEAAKEAGYDVTGPLPPDTSFWRMLKGDFDLVVSMYHDQGLIPLKTLAFDTGVNVTLGLPIVRTSPDHGTAFGIAGQGRADPASSIEAVKLAARLAASK